jgi:hypothetical protein
MKQLPLTLKIALERLPLWGKNKETPLLTSLQIYCEKTQLDKKRRKDWVDNAVNLLCMFVNEVELETLRIGNFYIKDDIVYFYNKSQEEYAKSLGLDKKTISRHVKDYEEAGYIVSSRRCAVSRKGEVIPHNSDRMFTDKFFRDLGAIEYLKNDRKYRARKNKKWFSGRRMHGEDVLGLKKLNSIIKNAFQGQNRTPKKHKEVSCFQKIAASKSIKDIGKPQSNGILQGDLAKAMMVKAMSLSKKFGTSVKDEFTKLQNSHFRNTPHTS